jgi:DNA replication licensing factor MCM7
MEEGDQTAIHEVMEQQTVSIAKAGITTTLNARAAVLAAANPVWGRWRLKASPEANLGLPASLLSRFDLTWIILDQAEEDNDTQLAQHVTYVHMNNKHPPLDKNNRMEPFDAKFLRAYIAKARTFEPHIPRELSDFIVQHYVDLRKDSDVDGASIPFNFSTPSSTNSNTRQRFCTARQLLSILRLAQAHARLYFREQVEKEDIVEALELINQSKQSYLSDKENKKSNDIDSISRIYGLIIGMFQQNQISKRLANEKIIAKGFQQKEFDFTIKHYQELNLWIEENGIIKEVVPGMEE